MLVHAVAHVNPSPSSRPSIMRATRNVYRWRSPTGARLSPAACALYLLWHTYLDDTGATPRWLTVERMADDIGHSERHVQRALRELTGHGLARAIQRARQATVYRPVPMPDTRPPGKLARDVREGDIGGPPEVTPASPPRVTPVSPRYDPESSMISLSNSGAPHERAEIVEEVARRAGCTAAEARDRIELAVLDGRGERYGWSIGYLTSWTRRGVEMAAGRPSSQMPRSGRAFGRGAQEEPPAGRHRRFAATDVTIPDDAATAAGLAMLRAALGGGGEQ